jgi:predicted transcriptional regulator
LGHLERFCGGRAMSMREDAIRLVEQLPEEFSWDDLMYEIYVRKAIEAGMADSKAGRTIPVEELRARFGLEP